MTEKITIVNVFLLKICLTMEHQDRAVSAYYFRDLKIAIRQMKTCKTVNGGSLSESNRGRAVEKETTGF